MREARRSSDGRNALPNIADEEVGLGSPVETEVGPAKQSNDISLFIS